MKNALLLILTLAMLLSFSACGSKGKSDDASGDTSVASAESQAVTYTGACYEDFSGVPDFGALCGYEQYTKTQYDELTLYSYEIERSGTGEKQQFIDDYNAFKAAAESLGYNADAEIWEDDMVFRVSCGSETVYASLVSGEHNGEILHLIIIAIGELQDFEAYSAA